MKKSLSSLPKYALWLCALSLRKCIKTGAMLGTPYFVCITPLLGSFTSVPAACGIFTALTIVNAYFSGLPLTLGIPTFFSVLSWSASTHQSTINKLIDLVIHVLIPLSCIGLFAHHTVGEQAIWYTLYWLIPVAAWTARIFLKTSNSFIFALQSTFVAHALGSVLWIFQMPTTPSYWLALIPLVAVERLTMAASMALLYEGGKILIFRLNTNKKIAPVLNMLKKTSA